MLQAENKHRTLTVTADRQYGQTDQTHITDREGTIYKLQTDGGRGNRSEQFQFRLALGNKTIFFVLFLTKTSAHFDVPSEVTLITFQHKISC